MSAMTARNVGTFSPVWRLIVAAACTVIALDAAAMGSRQAVQKTAAASSEAAQIEPEAMLVKTLLEIRNNRLEAALAEVDKVIRSYPNFRLAHLIKGDLLLDSNEATLTGGSSGPALVPGKPEESLLVTAIRYTDDDLQMPPKGEKLTDEETATVQAALLHSMTQLNVKRRNRR